MRINSDDDAYLTLEDCRDFNQRECRLYHCHYTKVADRQLPSLASLLAIKVHFTNDTLDACKVHTEERTFASGLLMQGLKFEFGATI